MVLPINTLLSFSSASKVSTFLRKCCFPSLPWSQSHDYTIPLSCPFLFPLKLWRRRTKWACKCCRFWAENHKYSLISYSCLTAIQILKRLPLWWIKTGITLFCFHAFNYLGDCLSCLSAICIFLWTVCAYPWFFFIFSWALFKWLICALWKLRELVRTAF